MHGNRIATVLAALALAIPLSGCDSSSPTAPAGPSPRAGDWEGTTGQGKTISFSVGGAAGSPRLTRYEVSIQVDQFQQGGAVGCLGREVGVSLEPANEAIVGGAFAFDIPALGATIRFEGAFDSAVSASGQLSVQTTGGACSGTGTTTWTAQPV